MNEIRLIIREELQSLGGGSSSINIEKKKRRVSSPRADTSAESGEVDSDVSQLSDSSGEEDFVCFPTEGINNLVKSVRNTMGVSESKEPQTPQEIMFAGLSQRKGHVFPINQAIKDLVKKEWGKGQKGLVPIPCKRRYPFDDEDLSTWTKIPKVDAAVASTSRRFSLPVEDAGSLSDPMDRKSDALLKKSWEACVTAFKPAIAATCTGRSMLVWLDQLEQNIKNGVSREKLRASIPLIKGAAAFISDASIDSLRLAARTANISNTARRALWLKNWKGDAQSRSKLCAIPCQGEYLFGTVLDDILTKAGERKKGFPNPFVPSYRRAFRKPPFGKKGGFRDRWNNKDFKQKGNLFNKCPFKPADKFQ
ncbi:lamina-associated polypeptide 2, isoforms alpha/zeta-like isoform X2 [Ranitomeya imitator]|uniref:lamina-associated polypeptide 2, isoforms alpha/zeta-like isoform X2 n=1 Tax=Ranitomeya imitator TaxID=111125 RepID=UPI0037E7BB1E